MNSNPSFHQQPVSAEVRSAFDTAAADGTNRTAKRISWQRHPILMARRWMRPRPPAPQQPATISRSELLHRLRRLPLGTWSYGWETTEVRHLGPMAQDFWATFGLGTSDRRLDLGDAIGVCMATICELADRLDDLEAHCADRTRQPTP